MRRVSRPPVQVGVPLISGAHPSPGHLATGGSPVPNRFHHSLFLPSIFLISLSPQSTAPPLQDDLAPPPIITPTPCPSSGSQLRPQAGATGSPGLPTPMPPSSEHTLEHGCGWFFYKRPYPGNPRYTAVY